MKRIELWATFVALSAPFDRGAPGPGWVQAAKQPFLETFATVLQDELDRRRSRLMERRFKHSGLSETVTLADLDWRFNPKLPRQACFELHTLKFIAEGANALIIGKPGTGKSHLAKAAAYQGTLQGYDVRCVEADIEFARYGLASVGEQARQLKDWIEPDLLILDDLFLPSALTMSVPNSCRPSCTSATSCVAPS